MQKILTIFTLVAAVAIFGFARTSDASDNQSYVFQLKGTAEGYLTTVPDINGKGSNLEATCFELELIDPSNGLQIGTALDCLSNITPVGVGGGVSLVGTTYFILPGGMLVTRGNTTVQPTTTTIERDGTTFTHITGANGSGNAVLGGTGQFSKAVGQVRLSGQVDLSMLASDGIITFDCVFIVDRSR